MSAPRPMGDHEAILRDWRRSVRVWEAVADGDGMDVRLDAPQRDAVSSTHEGNAGHLARPEETEAP
jgi:hypothetical protein